MMKQTTLNLHGRLFDLSAPQVMGIVNVTPDSFYTASRRSGQEALVAHIDEIIAEGGTMIDIGGCSTRPGSTLPSAREEMERLKPALSLLRDRDPQIPVSVDTFRADIAQMSVEEYGADIINDISGGTGDTEMFATIARLQVPYVLMHLRGGIAQMHQEASYFPNVETAVLDYFIAKVAELRELGVKDIILDPGYGFSKTRSDNFRLLANAKEAFRSLALPILTGISRKRMIWQTLGLTADEALNGTSVLNTIALQQGAADILRVHDVKPAVEAVKLVMRLREALAEL